MSDHTSLTWTVLRKLLLSCKILLHVTVAMKPRPITPQAVSQTREGRVIAVRRVVRVYLTTHRVRFSLRLRGVM